MTVKELIEALQAFHPDKPVGFFNNCAEDGTQFVSVDLLEISRPAR